MHYRLYGLHPVSGRITQGRDITATTDAEAIALGEREHAGGPFEIWCQSRRVFSSAGDGVAAR
ncbi:hypothetical protein [Sphingomonas oryzagri]